MADMDTVTDMVVMDTIHMDPTMDIRTSCTGVEGLHRQGTQATVALAAQPRLEDTWAETEDHREVRSVYLRRAVDQAARVVVQSHRLHDGARLHRVVRRETIARHRVAADVVLPRRAGRRPRAQEQPPPAAEAGALRATRGIVEQAEAGDTRKLRHLATTGRKQVHRGGVPHRLLRALHRLLHTRRLHHRHLLLQAQHQALAEATEETGTVVQLAVAGIN